MIIRCWGARGSIPVSGREYLKYGGSTTCMEVEAQDGQTLVIDAGSGIRNLGHMLHREGRTQINLLFTHAHWDHLLGFPFFRPIYTPGVRIDVHGCPFAQESIKSILTTTMQAPNFPVDLASVKAEMHYHGFCQDDFAIGPVTITPILLSHPNKGMGYRLSEGDKHFVFLTDNELRHVHPGGLAFEDYVRAAAGADLLIHDAEFTEEEYTQTQGWGHSVYTDALRLAQEAGVARLGLFHHNQERSDEALDAIVADCERRVAAGSGTLEVFAVHEGMELEL
jgi:phosphoribosyl 1,2-cyclic phosphodiesterase